MLPYFGRSAETGKMKAPELHQGFNRGLCSGTDEAMGDVQFTSPSTRLSCSMARMESVVKIHAGQHREHVCLNASHQEFKAGNRYGHQ